MLRMIAGGRRGRQRSACLRSAVISSLTFVRTTSMSTSVRAVHVHTAEGRTLRDGIARAACRLRAPWCRCAFVEMKAFESLQGVSGRRSVAVRAALCSGCFRGIEMRPMEHF